MALGTGITEEAMPLSSFQELSSHTFAGHVDGILGGTIVGWIWDARHPDHRTEFRLLIDGNEELIWTADLYRADLEAENIGDGWHGFSIPLPDQYLDGKMHVINIMPSSTNIYLMDDNIKPYMFNLSDPNAELQSNVKIIHMLFDSEFYCEKAGYIENPIDHYRKVGWKRGLDPHPLFSTDYYIESLGRDLIADPLTDFAEKGVFEYAEVHPLFDVQRYLSVRPDVAKSKMHPIEHYLFMGWQEKVKAFRLFDEEYYLGQCPGLIEAGFPPLVHYLRFGWREGVKPHRSFDPHLIAKLAGLSRDVEPLGNMIIALMKAGQVPKNSAPKTSIIILNLSKSVMTLQCLYFILCNTNMADIEIIIVDNGSNPHEFRILCEFGHMARIIRNDANLGFGEANNIGAEAALGENFIILNNDAFVTKAWLPPLLKALEEEGVGAAGPMFLYANGTVQEAGGSVGADGIVHQFGKGLSTPLPENLLRKPVRYTSAATLAIKADIYRKILGFDLIWDPAYYEDVDICLKVEIAGLKVMYEPASCVVHLENSTSSDSVLNLGFNNLVGINRVKFVSRWSRYLAHPSSATAPDLIPAAPPARTVKERPLLALFTPYALTPGGGERYILSFAHELREEFDCVLLTPQPTSAIRLATMARELDLRLDHVTCLRWRDRGKVRQPDIFVSMGNEILPYAEPIGRRNFFICQFPFPLMDGHYVRDWGLQADYDGVIVYSEFVKKAQAKAIGKLGLPEKPVSIVSPPVVPVLGDAARGDVVRILNVGRFHPHGHCKRQDVMIEAFKAIVAKTDKPIELHLAGALGADASAREYFYALRSAAEGLPVFFHVNNAPQQLADLYRSASIYWHITGIKENVLLNPEGFEHFGITILEAMSIGALPVVLKHGGPGEIVQNGVNGFLVGNKAELVESTCRVIDLGKDQYDHMSRQAVDRARDFQPAIFKTSLMRALGITETSP